jgi:protein-disulfide isomerase
MRSLLVLTLLLAPRFVPAQFVQPIPADELNKKVLAALKPPPGAKVAVYVFEDLGCPACAHDHPLELQATEQTHVPLLRRDFPIQSHIWTFEGAVCARYIQDHINPQLAAQFRSEVFANQRLFASREDIDRYFRAWLQQHGQQPPMAIDADGKLNREVGDDLQFGRSLNVEYTPTIIVVTKDKYQIISGTKEGPGANDITRLVPVIQAAQSSGLRK